MNLSTAAEPLPAHPWVDVCDMAVIPRNTGVCARVDGLPIAIFRVGDDDRLFALSNIDPATGVSVLSRGILGDLQGEKVVASPLYKQHYSLATGRCLEDGALSVPVYPVLFQEGRVLVSSQPLRTYVSTPQPREDKLKLVLVGNGLAGMRTLEDLLDMAPDLYQIEVFGAEPHGNYNRILLSPVLSGEKQLDDIMLHPREWYAERGISLHAGDPVVNIDRRKKQVVTASGHISQYDRLIMATGSKPFVPPIPGVNLSGVVTFRDIHDIEQMITASEQFQHAVVIGGGLLGLEAAHGLQRRGMQVTVVHLADRLMERQLDARAAELLKETLEHRGMRILTQANTQSIEGNDRVERVILASGEVIAADLVVMAVGIRPNIDLAKSANLYSERGIVVSDTLQTFDPSIYAVGECIQHRGQLFGLVEPIWGQAFVCAAQLAEQGRLRYQPAATATQLKVSGVDVFSAGDLSGGEGIEDIVLNDDRRRVYKRLLLKGDRLVGAVLYGDVQDGAWYAELIADATSIGTMRQKLMFGRDFALKKAS